MNFSRCGDSSESFYHNTLTNMMLDIDASLDFAIQKKDIIDNTQVGL